jgi:hypothetical protein
MTREEAIKEIIRAYDVLDFSSHMDNRRKEAFNMAKVALEQKPVLDKIRAEIFAEMQYHSGTGEEVIQAYADGLHNAIRIIDKCKAESEG